MHLNFQQKPPTPCPLCGGNAFTLLNSNDRYLMGLKTVGCDQCGLVQTNPRPTKDELTKFYQNDYRLFYQGVDTPDAIYVKNQKKQERQQDTFDFLKRFNAANACSRVLDVGCSEGTFFSILRQNGCAGGFLGVEPGTAFAQHAARIENTTVVSSMDEISGEFDLASMIHVLEHQSDPLAALITLRNALSASGLVYLDIPDADGYQDIDSLHIAHVFHFTQRTIQSLLARAGFSIIQIESYSPVNHPKSIRLLAAPNRSGDATAIKCSPATEQATWERIRQFSAVPKKIRHFATRIPGLRYVYRLVRRTVRL
jgi:SAM-dependent methyltransferase